ncbi:MULTISPECIES: Uma2 family endonuclease [Streptomyces]|uniref:Uma2 family endonuclease n=1 Tax=Streptomyces TaxID=1883 RepID=UPI001E4C2028|nr:MULTISPECIES: Uma2 family endonuclease [Streptomyces]UFQ16368.1 Uma2 family endonuclease [Streptomyces huasconensis]WCL85971.1 Uma2 family endonuclease [Streptomyces sp. JCM 35825]
MTLVDDRIKMADNNTARLDEMFEALERGPFLEGYKIDIIEGAVHMTPQRANHWDITLGIIEQLRTKYPRQRTLSDVRIDYPGELNAFCSDVALVAEGAERTKRGGFLCSDVEFVAEVISRGTGSNDYGPKKTGYATAGVAVYLIVDPYQGECHVYTRPGEGAYHVHTTVDFGEKVDLTHTFLGLTFDTSDFSRD